MSKKRRINTMTADDLVRYMSERNMGCVAFAERFDVEPVDVWDWLGDKAPVPEAITLKIRRIEASKRTLAYHARLRKRKALASKKRRP